MGKHRHPPMTPAQAADILIEAIPDDTAATMETIIEALRVRDFKQTVLGLTLWANALADLASHIASDCLTEEEFMAVFEEAVGAGATHLGAQVKPGAFTLPTAITDGLSDLN